METILDQLACSLNRRDEIPNQELAIKIVESKNKTAVKQLIENLNHKKKDVQSDCIKVLYEIGEREPSHIAAYAEEFIKLLDSLNNRMVWGAMSAINAIVLSKPNEIFEKLPKLIEIANKGSVITKDQTVGILLKLCSLKEYKNSAFPLFIEMISNCPTNQLGMYAENALPIINKDNKEIFVKTLTSRLPEIEKESQVKRLNKVIKKLS